MALAKEVANLLCSLREEPSRGSSLGLLANDPISKFKLRSTSKGHHSKPTGTQWVPHVSEEG